SSEVQNQTGHGNTSQAAIFLFQKNLAKNIHVARSIQTNRQWILRLSRPQRQASTLSPSECRLRSMDEVNPSHSPSRQFHPNTKVLGKANRLLDYPRHAQRL